MPPLTEGSHLGAVLYAEFGEMRPGEIADAPLIHSEMRELLQEVAQLQGTQIEYSAKKLVAAFRRPERALEMARALQSKMARIRQAEFSRSSLQARVVLAYGPLVLTQGRVRSELVNSLPALLGAVPPNGIGALREFVAQFPPMALQPPPRPTPRPELMVLPLPGAQTDETRMSFDIGGGGEDQVFLTITLRVRGNPVTVRPSDCPVRIGRDKSCEVQVSGDTASRVHGRIEFERDKFYYVDDSRNGTYVLTGSGQEILLKHEKIALVGEGAISPGAPLAKQTGEVVRFNCRPSRLGMMDDRPGVGDTRPMR